MTCYQCENYADRYDVLCGECARNLVKVAAADERERIAAWLEKRKIAAECDGVMWLDDTEIGWVDDVSQRLASRIRNGEHETGKAKAQED